MTARRLFPCLLAIAALPVVAPAGAQAMVQAVPGSTDADRLAAQMRLLAVDANDLPALLTAGELSVKLDDLGAAASFFARADRIDPRNGRAKAGEGAILVHAERPGEALRYFAQAEGFGLAPAAFAADRGLAYDLIGEQERAQRDYRLALRTAPDDEAQRRYALSLAIAGKRELADQELQPLLRKSDRGAWRVHAFVLAMAGNVAEASRIATTMMPPGTAAGLQPFLERLPTLSPVDRAYAVHFGEVRSTPQRVADARLAPALPALGPDPYAPRAAVAAVAMPDEKGKRRKDKKRAPVQVAVATPAPEPLPQAPSYRGGGATPLPANRGVAPAAGPTAIMPGARPSASPAVIVVARQPATLPVAAPPPAVAPRAPTPTPTSVSTTPAAPPAETNVVVAVTTPSPPVALSRPSFAQPAVVAASGANTASPASIAPGPVLSPAAKPFTAPPPASNPAVAQIVAGLPIPAAELGVAAPRRAPAVAPATVDQSAVDHAAADQAARAAAAKALADKRAADRKAVADKKALAEKKAAAAKEAEEKREAAAQAKLERANPERHWVQVSGGAYAADLPKAWAAVKAKGGAAFVGHETAWTTPLRFTNRILVGPFKDGAEARAFVNKLKAGGVETFPFTSEAGQVVTRLPTK